MENEKRADSIVNGTERLVKKKNNENKKVSVKTILLKTLMVLGITIAMIVIGLYSIMWICIHGPSEVAKNLFVLSVKETSAVGFLANIYLSDEEITEIINNNKVETTDEITDTSLIDIPASSETTDKPNSTENENDNKVDANKDNEGITIEDVTGVTYSGKMMIVKDPSRVFVGSSGTYGPEEKGMTVTGMIKKYDCVGGTNAGGFEDKSGQGNGAIPIGIVISEGELLYGELEEKYEVIGINKDNVLVVGKMTAAEAINQGIRDAISFGPILIVNGEASKVGGTGGGLNPRTAIGQRKDGAILILVIDGRQSTSLGASYNDLIKIMQDYGAVNAANLDGGSSSELFYKGQSLNTSASVYGARYIPTSILVRQENK